MIQGYTDVFKDRESIFCPVLTCDLYELGCTTLLNATVLNNIHMGTVKPWNVTINAAVEDGITINYCLKCDGGVSNVIPVSLVYPSA